MATVKDVMDEAARRCKVTAPTNWVSATTDTAMLFKDFLTETVEELLSRVDWPDPIAKDTTIVGSGVETYSLPTDFKRLTRSPMTVYETTTTRRAGIPISSNGDWTFLKTIGSAGGDRYYRTAGDDDNGYTIDFYRFPSASQSIAVSYISKNWLTTGTDASIWTNVAATLLLPPDLVRRGVIWRFRQDKGLPYADRMNEYEAILARKANDALNVRRIDMSGEMRSNAPWKIPVPDYIPPS